MNLLYANLLPAMQRVWPAPLSQREVFAAGVLFFSYIAAAQLGAALFTAPAVISPAPAVALAGLFLGGLRLWPVVLAAAVANSLLHGITSPLVLTLYPLSQTLQALVGAYLLKLLEFDPVLRRLRDIFIMILVAFGVSAIVPTIALVIEQMALRAGIPFSTPLTWATWWIGYFLSLLVVAPLIMRWFSKPRFVRTPLEMTETVGVLGVVGVISYFLFWTPYTTIGEITLVYLLLVPLFWTAIRFGPRFLILALFMVTATGLSGMIFGPTAPAAAELGQRLFQLEIFFIILSIIFYIVTALQEERRAVIKQHTSYINQLERALNRLSMQDRAKSEFVAVLAHELRNPLSPIVSSLELLRLQLPPHPQYEQVLELMDDRLKTIQRLLDDLLDVSRISRDKLRLKKEVVELRPIIERSVQSVEHYLKSRGQVLTLDLHNEPLVLDADPVRIEQIVSNLLTNASKFTPNGGRISVYTGKEKGRAIIRVVDSGIGINAELIDRIFEPFTQLGKSGGEGLGIGLSLTQKLAELHGGSIEARSEGEEKGSEFIVRLPIAQATAAPARRPQTQKTVDAPDAGEKKVLVVDDNEPAAHGIGKLLEHKGYIVEFAYTGEEARNKAITFNPFAIVLDIGLPDLNGYQVAKLIRKDGKFTGMLIALTGYGQEEDRQRSAEAGFDHHLTKPISIVDLEVVLRGK